MVLPLLVSVVCSGSDFARLECMYMDRMDCTYIFMYWTAVADTQPYIIHRLHLDCCSRACRLAGWPSGRRLPHRLADGYLSHRLVCPSARLAVGYPSTSRRLS